MGTGPRGTGPRGATPGGTLEEGRARRLASCLLRARAGDLGALDEVVVELNPLLWHVARTQGLTAEDAEDVVQTTWMELVRGLHAIEAPEALAGWLVSVTRREAWRADARRRKRTGPGADFLADRADDAPGPEQRVADDERDRVLDSHLARLSARCRALLRVVAQGGRPDYAGLAEALGVPRGSIGPTRGRCLAKLRALLLADPEWSAE